jgi:hypothetical protein
MKTLPDTCSAALFVLLLLACSLGTGCASFRSDRGSERSAAELDGLPLLPAVRYEVKSFDSGSIAGVGDPNQRIEPLFRRAFQEVERAELPASEELAPGDLHLDLLVQVEGRHPAVSFTLGLFFIASIGLFPGYAVDDVRLDALLLVDGSTVERYEYTERVTTWMHLFALPWAFGHDSTDVMRRVLDGMTLQLIADLRRDLPK